ncbi:ATP-binding protein [Streptomyces sp. NPDC091377]|uniref:ATP-binding protein n=1 Tax=Streptomyces sp. NPDC091377 TaxID=3365995 RepID=UPI00382A109B
MTTAVDGTVLDRRILVAPRAPEAQLADAEARSVRVLRREVAALLRHIGLAELIDSTSLVVSELMTNAMLHSGTEEIRLTIVVQNGFLHIVVIDGMPGRAAPTPAAVTAESGRGLLLVQSVAEDHGGTWGVSDAGARTWCRLAVPTNPGPTLPQADGLTRPRSA